LHGTKKPNADFISNQYRRMGLPVKKKLIRPDLRYDLFPFYEAFNVLTKDRPFYESIGYIPYPSIVMFANENGYKGVLRQELFHFLDKMDNAFVKEVNTK